jgi:hypothetical protein
MIKQSNLRHRTEHKMGVQGYNNNTQDETMNTTIFDNYLRNRIYIDSEEKEDGTYTNANYQNTSNIVRRGVSGVGIEEMDITYCIPNINDRNKNIKFHLLAGPVLSVDLDVKNYDTVDELFIEIVAKMNSVSAGFTRNVNNDCTVSLSNPTAYAFDSCSFIDRGASVHGLFYTSAEVLSIKSVANLQYTRFIDILVSDMLNGQISQSSYGATQSFNTNQHLARLFVDNVTTIPRKINKKYDKINYTPYQHRDLTNIQIRLLDEYNDPLYGDVVNLGGDDFELKRVKYNIILNTVF